MQLCGLEIRALLLGDPPGWHCMTVTNRCSPPVLPLLSSPFSPNSTRGVRVQRTKGRLYWEWISSWQKVTIIILRNWKKNVILDTDEVHGMKFNKVLLNLCKGLMILQQITVWSLSFENHCCSCWDCVIVVRGQHMLSGVISNTYLFLNLNFSIISVWVP